MQTEFTLNVDRYFFGWNRRQSSPEGAIVRVDGAGIVLPSRWNQRGVVSVQFSKVHSLIHTTTLGVDWLVVGAERSLPVLIRGPDLARPVSLRTLSDELRHRIAAVGGGPVHIAQVDRRAGFLRRLMRPPWFSISLVALFAWVYWVATGESSHGYFSVPNATGGAYIHGLVQRGEVHRVVTAGFLHADILHLLENSICFIVFGWSVEAAIGAKRTAMLILASSTFSLSMASLIFNPNWMPTAQEAVGSSAGVWGLLLAAGTIAVHRRKAFPLGFRTVHVVAVLATITLILASELEAGFGPPQVVHLLGGLCGILLALWMPFRAPLPMRSTRTVSMVALGALVVVVASGGGAWWYEVVHGDRPALVLAEECLEAPDIPDDHLLVCANRVVRASGVSREELLRAADAVRAKNASVPSGEKNQILAALYYRLGDIAPGVELGRDAWRNGGGTDSSRILRELYHGQLHGRFMRSVTQLPESSPLADKIELAIEPTPGGNAASIVASIKEPVSSRRMIHALGYTDGRLRVIIELTVEPETSVAECALDLPVDVPLYPNRTVLFPVWYGEDGAGSTEPAPRCRLSFDG